MNPVNNQKPLVLRNTGIKVWKGGIGLITSDNLSELTILPTTLSELYLLLIKYNFIAVEDKDTDVSNLTFVISSSRCGQVILESQRTERFTQAQIDQSIVFFKHSGENCDGELELMATDGLHSTGLVRFQISAEQASVKLLVNNPLRVFPMLGRQLTIDHLLAQCDDPNYQVTYIVKNAPIYGVITKSASYEESNQIAITNFTQKNINESAVWYHHISKYFSSNTSNDVFTFDVICEFADPIINQVSKIIKIILLKFN